ncbi:MAG: hypothetical protein KDG57_03300, partial [Rhodoferax sp.]|nr:hypothetical protein [Rhodoferax sp.]
MTEARNDPPAGPRHWLLRMLGWAGGLALAGIAGGALMVALALSVAYRNLPEVGNLADYRPK